MKPIKVICPICGEEMVADNWGKKRQIYHALGENIPLPCRETNYVNYDCSCGCVVRYEGETSCWQECKCAKGNSC